MARTVTQRDAPTPRAKAFWLPAALLAVLGVGLLTQFGPGAAPAAGQTSLGNAGRKMLAVPGQIARDMYGLYLVDVENATICVYQYLPGSGKLRLLASRNAAFDLQLEDYNTEPSPRAIRDLVAQQSRLESPAPGPSRPGAGQE